MTNLVCADRYPWDEDNKTVAAAWKAAAPPSEEIPQPGESQASEAAEPSPDDATVERLSKATATPPGAVATGAAEQNLKPS